MAVPALEGRAPAVDFTVAPPPGEFARVRMDAAEMRQAAEETKGRFYSVLAAKDLVADLPEGRQVPIETLPPHAAVEHVAGLALVLALLVGEWLLRKRGGMV